MARPRNNDSPIISQVLGSLRSKIRRYVLFHGICFALVWLLATFWVVLALDYLPVQIGLPELSRTFRLIFLFVILGVLAWILFRWVYRPAKQRVTRENLAVILERQFPELGDSLATVVSQPTLNDNHELAGLSQDQQQTAGDAHQRLMDETRVRAEQVLGRVALKEVFNYGPLIKVVGVCVLIACSIGWFAVMQPDSFRTAFQRIYLLDSQQWPRDCFVEIVGVRVSHAQLIEGVPQMTAVRPFVDNGLAVASGSRISLLIRAETESKNQPDRRLPEICEMRYRTANGTSGRLPFAKVGGSRNGFQNYALNQDFLESVEQTIEFYVRGDDHRIGPFTIKVVDAPVMLSTGVDCVFPDYLVDEASSRFTPRVLTWTNAMKIPKGTNAELQVQTNRPLQNVYVLDDQNQLVQQIDIAGSAKQFQHSLNKLEDDINFGYLLQDSEGVFSTSVRRIRLTAEIDEAPVVETRLSGIGVAVTVDATIPVEVELSDQHGVQQAWIELQTPVTEPIRIDTSSDEGTWRTEIDLRQLRIGSQIPEDLPTEPSGEVSFALLAQDRFDLDGETNIGSGNLHKLEVVTAGKLLRILEREEADQRIRLEQVYREMTDARAYLVRARNTDNSQAGFEPGDEKSNAESDFDDWDLRRLFVKRAILQTQKSLQEVGGIAFTFDDVRLQLINNRVDAQDRVDRIENVISKPLHVLHQSSMPSLEQRLVALDQQVRVLLELIADGTNRQGSRQTNDLLNQIDLRALEALTTMDAVLEEIKLVVDTLLKFETQNELLDIVRRMLEEQEAVRERTEALRNQKAFDDIFNK